MKKNHILTFAAALALFSGVVHAHTHLEKAMPADNSVLASPPSELMLHFSEATRLMAASYGTGPNPDELFGSRASAVTSRSGCEPCKYRLTPFGHSIPRLNGKSSQGSKPMTWLSRTLS